MKNNKKVFVSIIGLLILGVIATILIRTNRATMPKITDKYNTFAQCLTDKGAVFYGAFWCSHCQATKKMFGSAAEFLNYVECSTPDAMGQTQVCMDKKITGYPTWEFADGTRLSGEISFEGLAQKTACPLPN